MEPERRIYISMPKDLNQVKSKTMGKFTKRQLVYIVIAVIVGYLVFNALVDAMGTVGAAFATMFAASPMFVLVVYEKNGISFELMALIKFRYKVFLKIRKFKRDIKDAVYIAAKRRRAIASIKTGVEKSTGPDQPSEYSIVKTERVGE